MNNPPPGRRFPAEILATQIEQQRRHARAREVALRCAVAGQPQPSWKNKDEIDRYVACIFLVAAGFLPFLIGNDNPTT